MKRDLTQAQAQALTDDELTQYTGADTDQERFYLYLVVPYLDGEGQQQEARVTRDIDPEIEADSPEFYEAWAAERPGMLQEYREALTK